MGKNGERILWGKHFRIGNFPHFSPLKKNFERRSVFFKNGLDSRPKCNLQLCQ